jgi:TonB family protein
MAGHRKISVGGHAVDCEVVRGRTDATPPSTGEVKRELCIDKDAKSIVWEKDEYKSDTRIYTFTRVERDIDLPADVFRVEPPQESVQIAHDLPAPHPLGTYAVAREPDISPPRLISRREPDYDDASRRAGVEGVAVFFVVIDERGMPAEILLYRPLTPALNLAAAQALRAWRFKPATKAGQPIAVGSLVEFNFRLR